MIMRALTERERAALGELIKLATFFYNARKKSSQRNFGIICAERAVGILAGHFDPFVATDEDIQTFWQFWHPPGLQRRRRNDHAE